MAEDKLSAREAALIAQARAELAQKAPAAAPQRTATRPAAAAPANPAPEAAKPAARADPAERLAALMAAVRAESEQLRQRQRKLYLWTPLAFLSVLGLCALLWMWHRL